MYSPGGRPPPPVPPPKSNSHDASRFGSPTAGGAAMALTPVEAAARGISVDASGLIPAPSGSGSGPPPAQQPHSHLEAMSGANPEAQVAQEDPGDQWLPQFLQDKSKQDLAEILGSQDLLNALTHSPSTKHPSLAATDEALLAALNDNIGLANHLVQVEARLAHQRASAQAQLLSTHALERQWRQKEAEMDRALAPFAPSSLYQRLTHALQEQDAICAAMEESFLDGSGGGDDAPASERETLDWVRRYRDAKKLSYLRHERKERWNERRVGGWR